MSLEIKCLREHVIRWLLESLSLGMGILIELGEVFQIRNVFVQRNHCRVALRS
jgi:hypothetical protein